MLLPFQHRVSWRILPMPSASAVFDQLVIDGLAIRQEHRGNGAPVLVLAERLERDTTVTERIDRTESLRMNGIVDVDSSMRNDWKIQEKVGRPSN